MRLALSLFLICCFKILFAQDNSFDVHCHLNGNTFNAIQQHANSYFDANPHLKNGSTREDNLYLQFKRWEWYWQKRLMPDGNFADPMQQWHIYKNLQGKKSRNTPWKNISQTTAVSGYDGMGRVTSIAFHPSDSNIFFITAPKGGVWKTIDAGNTWQAIGDNLPSLAAGKILVSHANTNTLYVCMNDRNGWWNYSLGIYKSIDGGATWYPSGNQLNYNDNISIYDLAMHSSDDKILFSAQTDGLYKSNDSGATWVKKMNGAFNTIIQKPNEPNTWYASSYDYWNTSQVYKSIDTGNTWLPISNFSFTQNWITLSTTIADSNYLGICNQHSTNSEYWSSDNSGDSIQFKGPMDNSEVVVVSPYNKNIIYSGELDVDKSINGGTSWNRITLWYNDNIVPTVHADERSVAVHPITKKIYWCNDGGVYVLNPINNTWKDISNGLIITQFYKLDVSQSDTTFMIAGTQDNGGRKRTAIGVWESTNGGDAMQVAIHPTIPEVFYTTYVDGELYRTTDGWVADTYHDITPNPADMGDWITPYTLDPSKPNVIVAGYTDVYRSEDNGDNWTKISNNLAGANAQNLTSLVVAPNNSNVIYTSRANKIYVTKNLGTNWSSKNAPTSNGSFEEISSLAVHPKDENIVYFTKSGYSNGNQIFKSINGGTNFKNISYNLPNLPALCIIIDNESDSANVDMYLSMDAGGVFYKKDLDTVWQYYGIGLPNTEVTDMKIQYATGKLVIATYGRGIWETTIKRTVTPLSTIKNNSTNSTIEILYHQQNTIALLSSNKICKASYKLYDVFGNIVLEENVNLQIGKNYLPIPINHLQPQVYIVAFNIEGQTIRKKIIR